MKKTILLPLVSFLTFLSVILNTVAMDIESTSTKPDLFYHYYEVCHKDTPEKKIFILGTCHIVPFESLPATLQEQLYTFDCFFSEIEVPSSAHPEEGDLETQPFTPTLCGEGENNCLGELTDADRNYMVETCKKHLAEMGFEPIEVSNLNNQSLAILFHSAKHVTGMDYHLLFYYTTQQKPAYCLNHDDLQRELDAQDSEEIENYSFKDFSDLARFFRDKLPRLKEAYFTLSPTDLMKHPILSEDSSSDEEEDESLFNKSNKAWVSVIENHYSISEERTLICMGAEHTINIRKDLERHGFIFTQPFFTS